MASLVVYVFAMGQAIYFREERAGVAKTEKREKEENKFVHKEAWEDFMQVPPIFGICIILIFLVLFEWKWLNKHHFILP